MLLDLTHTSHTGALTGIQRVARGLARDLGDEAQPICRDPYVRAWRRLEPWERASLRNPPSGDSRRARWPLRVRLRALLRRRPEPIAFDKEGAFLEPEIFSPDVSAALGPLFAAVRGPRAAIFYDAIALKLPEMMPSSVAARYPAYLRELLAFDGVAAISADAREALVDYWKWVGVPNPPPVASIPLGVEVSVDTLSVMRTGGAGTAPDSRKAQVGRPVVLSVGTIEGRKNHAAMLEACEQLWSSGMAFELRLIGAGRPETARAALERIEALRAAGRPVRHEGAVSDEALEAAYAECAFTVYPSLMEGFGLPVVESLVRGRPCVCSAAGAIGESARGGGCLALEAVDAASLAGALRTLLTDDRQRERLAGEARSRTFKTSAAYANEIRDWMGTLKRR